MEAGWRLGDRTLYHRAPMFRGDDVRELQRMLNALGFDSGKEDGFYGPRTDGALRVFQRNVGDEPDGIVGPHTLSVLRRMRPLDAVPSRALVREREELDASRGPIEGQDHRDRRRGGRGRRACIERSAVALVDELRAVGADPRVLGTDGEAAAPSDRARLANEAGAAASITVELTARDEEGGGGPVCSYFGSRTTHSPSGLVLAQLILEELEAELGVSGRVRPLTIAPLRETRMPAVQVEPLTGIGSARGRAAARSGSPDARRPRRRGGRRSLLLRVGAGDAPASRGRGRGSDPRMVAFVARSRSDGYRLASRPRG